MATLKDVAKIANVDISTVSRALNNKGNVHPETRQRILDAVKELSYRPNLLAKGLRLGKKSTLGVVVPSLSMTVFSDMIHSIMLSAEQIGYSTMIIITNNDSETELKGLMQLRAGFVDGIIIASTGGNQPYIKEIHCSGIPIVQIVRNHDDSIPSVIANYYNSAYSAVSFLHSKNCNTIGLISGFMNLTPYRERYLGYVNAVNDLSLERIVFNFSEDSYDYFNLGYRGALSLLSSRPDISSIIVPTDLTGMGTLRALKEAKKSVPAEVSLINLTGNSIGNYLETTMTSMEIPTYAMGKRAVNILDNLINKSGEVDYVQHIVYNHTLVERETTCQ